MVSTKGRNSGLDPQIRRDFVQHLLGGVEEQPASASNQSIVLRTLAAICHFGGPAVEFCFHMSQGPHDHAKAVLMDACHT